MYDFIWWRLLGIENSGQAGKRETLHNWAQLASTGEACQDAHDHVRSVLSRLQGTSDEEG